MLENNFTTMNISENNTMLNDNCTSMYELYGLNGTDYDFDYAGTIYIGEIKQVPVWECVLKIVVYVLIMLVAVTGNVLIIIVVGKNKRMQTTTNYYIVNLAVSDLLVTVFCTWVKLVDDLTEGWVLGGFFCKINSFAQVLSLVASIFSLILIACDRFFGIVFSMKAHIIERKASHSIVIIWIVALFVALPVLFVRKINSVEWSNHVEIWCSDDWPVVAHCNDVTGITTYTFPGRQAFYASLTIVLYFFPVLLMSCMYVLIIITVWFARSPGERIVHREIKVQRQVKRKVVKMLILILATFSLCWLPLQICILYAEFRSDKLQQFSDLYYKAEFISYTLAFSNSAFNPIIYAGFNDNFRKGFRTLFGCYDKKHYRVMSRVDSVYSSTTMSKV